MAKDIIDNRNQDLLDHVRTILSSTERARFAVGYLFLSGLIPIREELEQLTEIRLLIGSITNRVTLEMLAERHKRRDLLQEELEKWQVKKRVEMTRSAAEAGRDLREVVALMDQTDDDEATIRMVLRLVQEKRIQVRVYTKSRLHAKAYIFDYGPVYDVSGKPLRREEKGIGIVGSSNLTLAGLTHNAELNVLVHGNENHTALAEWFDKLWEESSDFEQTLMQVLKESWAIGVVGQEDGRDIMVRPYDIYMKALYELVRDRLEEDEEAREILWDDAIIRDLADFQKVAVKQAIQMIRDYGGCFAADVVGLGKSYIGTAVVKHFERTEHARPLVICPKGLVKMWERYNEKYELNARVLSMGLLREGNDEKNFLLEDLLYRDRDFVLVDESHNFRHEDTQRYRLLQGFLATGRKCLFLTATPRAKSAWDVYHQIKLYLQDDLTAVPIDPPSLKEFFRKVDTGERQLQDVLTHILIRRTRSHILRWYGYDAETDERVNPDRWEEYRDGLRRAYILVAGKKQFFPRRELMTITYSIEEAYQGLYQRLREYLGQPRTDLTSPPTGELTYARYGLWHYVKKDQQRMAPYTALHQAGANLRGLIRVLLFKRFESSVYAFRETLMRLLKIHKEFLNALDESIVPAGEEAQTLLYESDSLDETELFDTLRRLSGRYRIEDFDDALLKRHIEQDIRILTEMISLVEPITPDTDAKLQTLKDHLSRKPLSGGKRLIFTQYADTAEYLYENLKLDGPRNDIEVIYSSDKSRERVVGRFAPRANPWYKLGSSEEELNTVIATDVLAEGLNLQDCDKVINYDLHWNPVRLIQRFGRIDRIGSEYDRVFAYNFLPEIGIERQLGLRERLEHRITEIHETIGEDTAILDPSETLNEAAMYAIYEQKGDQLGLFDEQQEEPMTIAEAEEFLRQLKTDDPEEFDRIVSLSDGIRTARASETAGTFAFLRAGRYQQLLLFDHDGKARSRDISEILSAISCTRAELPRKLPKDYNKRIMVALEGFRKDVADRISRIKYTSTPTQGQQYVLRELRVIYGASQDEDLKRDITTLERAFRYPVTVAVRRELNRIRRNGVVADALLTELKRIYFQHSLKDVSLREPVGLSEATPRIVCSEALL